MAPKRNFAFTVLLGLMLSPSGIAKEAEKNKTCGLFRLVATELGEQLFFSALSMIPATPQSIKVYLAPFKIPANILAALTEAIARPAEYKKIYKDLLQRFGRDRRALTTWLLLLTYVTHRMVDQSDFYKGTSDFEDQLGVKNYIVVDGFASWDSVRSIFKRNFEIHYAGKPNVHYIQATNLTDLIKQMREIVQKHGPIYGFDFGGHGDPGLLSAWGRALVFNDAKADGLLEEGAKIRLYSCTALNGEEGDQLIQRLNEVFLRRGGTIYGATLPIVGSSFFANDLSSERSGWGDALANYYISSTPLFAEFLMYLDYKHIRNYPGFDVLPDSKVKIVKVPALTAEVPKSTQ